jgi:hypothetical protein
MKHHPGLEAPGNRRHAAWLRETAARASDHDGVLKQRGLLKLASQYDRLAEQNMSDAARLSRISTILPKEDARIALCK